MGPTTVEELSDTVCRASHCVVPEVPSISMGLISLMPWMDQHENLLEQVWHTREGTFRRKCPPDVRDDPMRGQ